MSLRSGLRSLGSGLWYWTLSLTWMGSEYLCGRLRRWPWPYQGMSLVSWYLDEARFWFEV